MRPIRDILEDFVPLNEQQETVKRDLEVYVSHYVGTIDLLRSDVMRLEKLIAEDRSVLRSTIGETEHEGDE